MRAIRSKPSDEPGLRSGPSDAHVASLEADVAYYKELAEVQRKEAEEAKHTLGGAIVSNARMASFFEEIQVERSTNWALIPWFLKASEASAQTLGEA